jgi:hypothetical protein
MYTFVRYLSYGILKIHRKLTSGYLVCDKASLSNNYKPFLINLPVFCGSCANKIQCNYYEEENVGQCKSTKNAML